MSPASDFLGEKTRILVPAKLPDPKAISPWLTDFLEPLEVHLLGAYLVKDQTTLEQARDQFEEEASEQLAQLADSFSQTGSQVETKLVFTHSYVDTVERLEEELDIDVTIVPKPVERISSLLAVVTDDMELDRMRKCIEALLEDSVVPVTLLHVAPAEDDEADKEEKSFVLDGVKQRLVEGGIDEERIETRSLDDPDPEERIVEISRDFDVVIMAETEDDIRDQLLREAPSPVIVVHQRQQRDEE